MGRSSIDDSNIHGWGNVIMDEDPPWMGSIVHAFYWLKNVCRCTRIWSQGEMRINDEIPPLSLWDQQHYISGLTHAMAHGKLQKWRERWNSWGSAWRSLYTTLGDAHYPLRRVLLVTLEPTMKFSDTGEDRVFYFRDEFHKLNIWFSFPLSRSFSIRYTRWSPFSNLSPANRGWFN